MDKEVMEKIPNIEYKKNVGKVYSNNRTYVLCTGSGKTTEVFSGIVVKQTDSTSNHQVGDYSTTWTSGIFVEEISFEMTEPQPWREKFQIF